MIISAVVPQVFYYNHLWNLKEYKHFHQRVKTGTTFMQKDLITSNGHIFFFHYFLYQFQYLGSTSSITRTFDLTKINQIKGNEKVTNINAAGTHTTKTCAAKWKIQQASHKTFHLVCHKVKNVSCESFKKQQANMPYWLW